MERPIRTESVSGPLRHAARAWSACDVSGVASCHRLGVRVLCQDHGYDERRRGGLRHGPCSVGVACQRRLKTDPPLPPGTRGSGFTRQRHRAWLRSGHSQRRWSTRCSTVASDMNGPQGRRTSGSASPLLWGRSSPSTRARPSSTWATIDSKRSTLMTQLGSNARSMCASAWTSSLKPKGRQRRHPQERSPFVGAA